MNLEIIPEKSSVFFINRTSTPILLAIKSKTAGFFGGNANVTFVVSNPQSRSNADFVSVNGVRFTFGTVEGGTTVNRNEFLSSFVRVFNAYKPLSDLYDCINTGGTIIITAINPGSQYNIILASSIPFPQFFQANVVGGNRNFAESIPQFAVYVQLYEVLQNRFDFNSTMNKSYRKVGNRLLLNYNEQNEYIFDIAPTLNTLWERYLPPTFFIGWNKATEQVKRWAAEIGFRRGNENGVVFEEVIGRAFDYTGLLNRIEFAFVQGCEDIYKPTEIVEYYDFGSPPVKLLSAPYRFTSRQADIELVAVEGVYGLSNAQLQFRVAQVISGVLTVSSWQNAPQGSLTQAPNNFDRYYINASFERLGVAQYEANSGFKVQYYEVRLQESFREWIPITFIPFEHNGKQPITLMYLNRFGMFETFQFTNGMATEIDNNAIQFRQSWVYNPTRSSRESRVRMQEQTKRVALTSQPLNRKAWDGLKDLVSSSDVYLLEDGEWVSYILTGSNYDTVTNALEYSLTVQLQASAPQPTVKSV